MRALAAKQGRNWQELCELAKEHYRKHGPMSEDALQETATPEQEAFVADMMRMYNRSWDMWEAELLMRTSLQDSISG